jgi:hypothetical protein
MPDTYEAMTTNDAGRRLLLDGRDKGTVASSSYCDTTGISEHSQGSVKSGSLSGRGLRQPR